jgi:hypothetical protein
MRLTGKNLALARRGVDLALDELHYQVATCPDVCAWATELDALEDEVLAFKSLARLMDKAIERETCK